jgi:hypothetical protein
MPLLTPVTTAILLVSSIKLSSSVCSYEKVFSMK